MYGFASEKIAIVPFVYALRSIQITSLRLFKSNESLFCGDAANERQGNIVIP